MMPSQLKSNHSSFKDYISQRLNIQTLSKGHSKRLPGDCVKNLGPLWTIIHHLYFNMQNEIRQQILYQETRLTIEIASNNQFPHRELMWGRKFFFNEKWKKDLTICTNLHDNSDHDHDTQQRHHFSKLSQYYHFLIKTCSSRKLRETENDSISRMRPE